MNKTCTGTKATGCFAVTLVIMLCIAGLGGIVGLFLGVASAVVRLFL